MLLVAYQARPAGLRACGPALGSGGVQDGLPARPQGQAGDPKHPSDPRGRATRPAAATARAGPQVALRVHLGAWGTLQHRRVRPHGRAGGQGGQAGLQGAPAHAQTRLRVCAGQQGARHKGATGLPWPPEHSAHGALYRAVADAVQGFLALTSFKAAKQLSEMTVIKNFKPCGNCGRMLAPRAQTCPHCGFPSPTIRTNNITTCRVCGAEIRYYTRAKVSLYGSRRPYQWVKTRQCRNCGASNPAKRPPTPTEAGIALAVVAILFGLLVYWLK